MKLVRTMFNCTFGGYRTIKEINEIRKAYNKLALDEQKMEQKDHRVYAWYEYDEQGELIVANFYRGVSKTDEEYEAVAMIRNSVIYAIHRT